MKSLAKRVDALEEADGTGTAKKPFFIIHVLSDGQVFDPLTETFFLDQNDFLSVVGKAQSEITLLPMHHDCTAEEFTAERERGKAATAMYQPGPEAQAMIAEGIAPAVAIHLERMKNDPAYDRKAANAFYATL